MNYTTEYQNFASGNKIVIISELQLPKKMCVRVTDLCILVMKETWCGIHLSDDTAVLYPMIQVHKMTGDRFSFDQHIHFEVLVIQECA